MWNIAKLVGQFSPQGKFCAQYREALEDLHPGTDRDAATAELEASLPGEVLCHAASCSVCEETSDTFWASRHLLLNSFASTSEARTEAVNRLEPWFATRVMARIAEREAEGRRALSEWSAAVARFSSRVALVSAAALVVCTTFFYGPAARRSNEAAVQSASQNSQQYLFDGTGSSASVDDALAGPAGR